MTLLIFSIATRNCTSGTLGRKKREMSFQTLYSFIVWLLQMTACN